MPGALDGVRVVDVMSGIPGALATMVLSDHGAEVVKVEPPGGDPIRCYGGSVVWNRGKKSVVLDLGELRERERLLALLATADVLVEGSPPGTMAGWGLDYDSVRGDLPALIYCSVTGYGRNTAASDRPAIDLLVQARSGQQYEQPGWRDGPIFLPRPLPSLGASFLVMEGVIAALYAREVTGRGQWVETSLYQGVLAFTTQLWQDIEHRSESVYSIARDPQPGMFECADGLWVHSMHMAGGRGKDRSAVWRILDMEDPATGATAGAGYGRAAVDALRPAFKRLPRRDLLEQFWANDIAVAPVRPAHEAIDDPIHREDGIVVDVDDPVHGRTHQVGITFHLNGAPAAAPQGPQPAIGQHTHEVLDRVAEQPARARRTGPGRPLAHALDGVKVLDLGNFLAGPFGPMLLGDLGAKVYKLESPEGDQMRPVTLPFNGCQRGKLDICADLKTPEGREIAHRLIAQVDVVHHNMRPGVAERLGVDYETAKALNPRIVYCHTTMWGLDGPRAGWPGFDQLGQSSCGLEHELGGDGNPPVWYRFGMCDQACACQSAVAVLLALYWRERTGKGQFVDTSIVSGGLFYSSDQWTGDAGPSSRPTVDQQQTGFGPLYRLYRSADGWIALACLNDDHFRSLTTAMPTLQGDTRFGSREGRARHGAELADILERLFAPLTSSELFSVLDDAGVPVEIADEDAPTSWFDAPDLVASGLVVEYPHAEYGRFRQFGHLVHFSETPGRIGGPPPLLGEHSRQVLAELGYSPEEMEALRERRVTTWPT